MCYLQRQGDDGGSYCPLDYEAQRFRRQQYSLIRLFVSKPFTVDFDNNNYSKMLDVRLGVRRPCSSPPNLILFSSGGE
jgi:hypothetical protein